jgi:type III secretory pathway component EscS
VNIHPLLLDGLIAAAVAVVLLVVTPGVAIAGLLAIVILIFCAITLLADRRRLRRAPSVRRLR